MQKVKAQDSETIELLQKELFIRCETYRGDIEQELARFFAQKKPNTLYDPARYILKGKGKRIRPLLLLLTCEALGGDIKKALPFAVSLEILHNYLLIHDDVMDHADLRHGRQTIHKKWDENVAILTGDMMYAASIEYALQSDSLQMVPILHAFSRSMRQVCEGQSMDMEFEKKSHVSVDEYFEMIDKKTGQLLSLAFEVGGWEAGASSSQISLLTEAGLSFGRAFQLQDDLLDVMSESGKVLGGDLIQGKKTFLLLRTIECATGEDLNALQSLVTNKGVEAPQVPKILDIYKKCGVLDESQKLIKMYMTKTLGILSQLSETKGRKYLIHFVESLMKRSY